MSFLNFFFYKHDSIVIGKGWCLWDMFLVLNFAQNGFLKRRKWSSIVACNYATMIEGDLYMILKEDNVLPISKLFI
jgi:hypothetical protein